MNTLNIQGFDRLWLNGWDETSGGVSLNCLECDRTNGSVPIGYLGNNYGNPKVVEVDSVVSLLMVGRLHLDMYHSSAKERMERYMKAEEEEEK